MFRDQLEQNDDLDLEEVDDNGEWASTKPNKKKTKKKSSSTDVKHTKKAKAALRPIKAKALHAFVAKRSLTLVAFISSTKACGAPCSKLKNMMESAADSLAAGGTSKDKIELAIVKLKDDKALKSKMVLFGLARLPALVWYRHGAAREWVGSWPIDDKNLHAETVLATTGSSTQPTQV